MPMRLFHVVGQVECHNHLFLPPALSDPYLVQEQARRSCVDVDGGLGVPDLSMTYQYWCDQHL